MWHGLRLCTVWSTTCIYVCMRVCVTACMSFKGFKLENCGFE